MRGTGVGELVRHFLNSLVENEVLEGKNILKRNNNVTFLFGIPEWKSNSLYTLLWIKEIPLSASPSICAGFFEISTSRNLIFELNFLSILNLTFAGYTGSKNQV